MSYILDEKPDLEYLAHFGVKGMKWGVRKARDKVGRGFSRAKSSALKFRDTNIKNARNAKQRQQKDELSVKRRKNSRVSAAALTAIGMAGASAITALSWRMFVNGMVNHAVGGYASLVRETWPFEK